MSRPGFVWLASQSPRRAQLLRQIGVDFRVLAPDAGEDLEALEAERRGELPWNGPPGRLLDFGCGGGSFLKRMADRGWDVTGLDTAVETGRAVQEELGLRVLTGSLPHPDLPPCSFDVVTMWHSLEHVHRPLAVLREAFRLLVPGGKLVVACPNIESLSFYWFGSNWYSARSRTFAPRSPTMVKPLQ